MLENKQQRGETLKDDGIFQTLFARKGNEEFLINFLNALLGIQIKDIKIMEEVNIEKLSKEEKGGRLDLQAVLNNKVIVNIEMQKDNKGDITVRTTFYSAKTISKDVGVGTDYKDIKKTIIISILNYIMFPKFEDYVSKTAIVLDKYRDYIVTDHLEWWYIELPKFRKSNPDMNEKVNQWLAFIDGEKKEWIDMATKNNAVIEKAVVHYQYLTAEEEERRLQDLRQKWALERSASEDYFKNLGKKEGRKEGRKQEKKQNAKKFKSLGVDIEIIAKATGLSQKEIEKL